MSTRQIARLENATPAKSQVPTARIAFGVQRARRRRLGWLRPEQGGRIPGDGVSKVLSIEEEIAWLAADNPSQLYRGGV
jgi:hypothetical protein